MKIVIIRHADPDYQNNCLTERGIKEAKALGKMYSDKDFDYIYCSTLNRAKLTAKAVIKHKKINYEDYLIEFYHPFQYKNKLKTNWDFLPLELEGDFVDLKDNKTYLDNKYFKSVKIKQKYKYVVNEFDKTLAKYGYKREKDHYRVTKSNDKTIVFFCHFGMMSVLLSHLTSIPYTLLAQHFCCLPTGVTTLISEERRKGIAQFRCLSYGNLDHLKKENIKPAFSARFCEQYKDKTRHD